MRKLPGLGPDGFSRAHIIQFVAVGTIVTGAQGFFLHEATCHESVTMSAWRPLRSNSSRQRNVPAEPFTRQLLIHEEHEDSWGVSRERG